MIAQSTRTPSEPGNLEVVVLQAIRLEAVAAMRFWTGR
jgi:hypothetical protein